MRRRVRPLNIDPMVETEFVRHIFECDIVRNDVLFQPGRERFPQNRLGIKIMAFCPLRLQTGSAQSFPLAVSAQA